MKVRCPICDRTLTIETISELPTFPFCSDRCRLVDLGRWLDGDYMIAGSPADQPEEPADADPEEHD